MTLNCTIVDRSLSAWDYSLVNLPIEMQYMLEVVKTTVSFSAQSAAAEEWDSLATGAWGGEERLVIRWWPTAEVPAIFWGLQLLAEAKRGGLEQKCAAHHRCCAPW